MRHLVFQLCAPMASFGTEGARMERPTDNRPRKSMVVGFLGAARGLKREDPWLATVSDRLGFATAVLGCGAPLSDYHTVATPPGTGTYMTRADELEESTYTIQTIRDYVTDFYGLVALWVRQDEDLEKLRIALEEPVFELFVGRKCCTLALPPAPEIVESESLADAFRSYGKVYQPLLKDSECLSFWDTHPNHGMIETGLFERLDDPRGHLRYGSRKEHAGSFLLRRK